MGSRHFFTIVFYKFDGHDFCKIQALLIYDSFILLQDICTEKFGRVNTRSVGDWVNSSMTNFVLLLTTSSLLLRYANDQSCLLSILRQISL